jgi:hypothetical protein
LIKYTENIAENDVRYVGDYAPPALYYKRNVETLNDSSNQTFYTRVVKVYPRAIIGILFDYVLNGKSLLLEAGTS